MSKISAFKKQFGTTAIGALFYGLFVMLALYMISRLIFFNINSSYFPGLDGKKWAAILKGGLVFDLSANLYINALFVVMLLLPFPFRYRSGYWKTVKWLFIITNSIALLVNSIDFIYYRFTLRRTTIDVVKEFAHEETKTTMAVNFLKDYWYVYLIYAALIFVMVWSINRVKLVKPKIATKKWQYYGVAVFTTGILGYLAWGGMRGGFAHSVRPINMSNAGAYVSQNGEIPLVLNTPFCVIRTLGKKDVSLETYYTDVEAENILSPVHHYETSTPFKNKNIVIILLESFGRENIGFYNKEIFGNDYSGYTPFLDSLLGHSYVAWNGFANGRKSIDALPSILAGIPSGESPFISTPFIFNKMKGMPAILKEKGYHTSFFHGAPNGSMGFDAIVKLLGVDHYYGKNEYNNNADYDGMWGIWDEPFLQFFAKNLDTIPQPFISTFFSVSSHHPFKVPPQYEGRFKEGPLPVQKCFGYTDNALRLFFEKVSKTEWYKNTIFVISADHATVTFSKEYSTAWGNYAIPIFFFSPGDTGFAKVNKTQVIQQTDIMPSLLSYLNYNGSFVAYGKNVFDSTAPNYAVAYNNGWQWIHNNWLLQLENNHALGLYNYQADNQMQKNELPVQKALADSLTHQLKAFIQQYHNRLIKDELLP